MESSDNGSPHEHRAALLDQLRLDRTQPVQAAAGRGRLWWAMGVIVLLIVAAAGVWMFRSHATGTAAQATADAESSTGTATTPAAGAPAGRPAAGTSLLDASGYVVARRAATVSAKGIYKVVDVLIQGGETVTKGQVIARLDDTNTHAALVQSQAQLQQTEAALAATRSAAADAKPSYVRDQKQLAQGLISPEKFDVSKASYDAAQAAVAVAEQNVSVARAAVAVNQSYENDTIIRAPFDGVVTMKNAQPGEIVSPQFSGGGGIARVVDMNSLEVDVDVSENFISRVYPHQQATITLDAYPDWKIPAEVIAIVPTADRSKATVQVRVGFQQKDARIVPEMGARVSFLERTKAPETKG